MDNPFKFLEDDEWQVLVSHAEARQYHRNDTLIEEGTTPGGMHIISSGTVKVVVEPAGFRIIVSEHGPGAIFGEMSFIESERADASVVALNEVEALYIDHGRLREAIKQSPMLYGHFYQSLAWLLSRRLRKTTGKIGSDSDKDPWLVED